MIKNSTFVAFGLCFLTYTTTSLADWKAYHGAGCIKMDVPTDGTINRDGIDGIYADGSSWAYVVCPIVRDRINSSTSLGDVYVELREATAGDGQLWCSLFTQGEDSSGGIVVDFEHQYSNDVAGLVQLHFSSVSTSSGNEGAIALECLLRPGDYLFHYLVEESDSASD